MQRGTVFFMSRIFIAELIGTAFLVLFGCGAAVLTGAHVGMPGIALAFGLSIGAATYGTGPISGAHRNPAVSLAAFIAGRMTGAALATYVVAQVIGAVIGAALVCVVALGRAGHDIAVNGLTLTGIHLVGINVTGVSVNPARSFGPAPFVGGKAMAELRVFILAPLTGGTAAGLLPGMGVTRAA